MDEKDIYRAAKLLIDKYGDMASLRRENSSSAGGIWVRSASI